MYEQRCIDGFDAVNSGYNLRILADSQFGIKHSKETRDKISASLLGNTRTLGRKHTDAHKEKIRLAGIGRVCTPDTAKKISDSKRGKKRSPETIEKMRMANLGKKVPDSVRAKMSASHAARYAIRKLNVENALTPYTLPSATPLLNQEYPSM